VKNSRAIFKPLALRERGWGEGFKGVKGSNYFEAITLLAPPHQKLFQPTDVKMQAVREYTEQERKVDAAMGLFRCLYQ
jgi:hypothetical protein